MKKKYQNKALIAGMVLVAVGAYASGKPFADMIAPHVAADQNNDTAGSGNNESAQKAQEKQRESAKKTQEVQQEATKKSQNNQQESAKKSEEIKIESAKKIAEIKQESMKKQSEILQQSQQQKTSVAKNKGVPLNEGDADVSNVENDGDEDDIADTSVDGVVLSSNDHVKKATEKIAEAEKYILEQQSEGKDVTIALERLAQAKNMLKVSDAAALDPSGKNSSEDFMKEALKLTHAAQTEDVHAINDVDKFIKKASERIDHATEKIAELKAVGGDITTYQVMLDMAIADLKSAKDMILKNASLLDTAALAQQSEAEAKSATRGIDAALLTLGGEDKELSGEHKSVVAKAVEDLLYVASVEHDNGIGAKVREIARAQRDSADTVNTLVDDAQSRNAVSEFVLGPKYTDLQGIQDQITANQARIQSLLQIMPTLSDPELQAIVQEHITALSEEDTKLQGFIAGKEKHKGIFGWFFRLMQ